MWGPAIVMVRVVCPSVCLSVTRKYLRKKRDRRVVTKELEKGSGLPDSESAIRFAIGSMVPPHTIILLPPFYRVSQKITPLRNTTLTPNFIKTLPIFKICLLLESPLFATKTMNGLHHTLNMLLHYLEK